jgi:hypothetical protein
MTRPLLELADIVRGQGDRFLQHNFRWIHWAHRKVLHAIARCRTAALGGHRDQCPRCGYRTTSYNSCRDRHCPKCQSGARDRWIMARQNELLPVAYVHVVFTLPHQLSPLALQNKKVLYDLLFRASAETLQEVARDPRHLGADIGFLSVLHTWGQNLLAHPHVHCVVPSGGLSPDGTRWIHPRYPFFLPVHVLSRVFRGKFVAGLKTPIPATPTHLRRNSSTPGQRQGPGARSLTLPNQPTMLLSTARVFRSDRGSVSTHCCPLPSRPNFRKSSSPYRRFAAIAAATDSPRQPVQPSSSTNKSRIAHAKPITLPRPPCQRLRTNPPIASAPA